MLIDKINGLLSEAGYRVSEGKFKQDTYAIIELNPHRAALQINTTDATVADDYETILKSGGLNVNRSPGTYKTLYVGVRGYNEKRL